MLRGGHPVHIDGGWRNFAVTAKEPFQTFWAGITRAVEFGGYSKFEKNKKEQCQGCGFNHALLHPIAIYGRFESIRK